MNPLVTWDHHAGMDLLIAHHPTVGHGTYGILSLFYLENYGTIWLIDVYFRCLES